MDVKRRILCTCRFYAQQAIEKILKTYLIAKNVKFREVHSTVTLAKDCAQLDRSFLKLVNQLSG